MNTTGEVSETVEPLEAPVVSIWRRRRVILAIVLLGLMLRVWAAWQLPEDFDEPVYLNMAYDYAELLRAGDLNRIIDYPAVPEHPPLTRLLYGLTVLVLGNQASWSTAVFFTRLVSVIFGTLGVWLMAAIDPLAGFFWAVQTLAVKYTSQVYLEALPIFTSLVAVFAMRRSQKNHDIWFWLSALALGITAAGKYSYFPILFVVLYIAIWQKGARFSSLVLFAGLATLTFWVFDPALWHDPISRLLDSLLFHTSYAQGSHVQEVAYPWYQPLLWVSRSNGFLWHPEVFFFLGIDGLIFLLALPGLWLERKTNRYIPVWAAVGILFLLLWPTKWPQYTLVLLPGLCLAAAAALRALYRYAREQETYWEWLGNMFPRPSRRYMISAGVVMGCLVLAVLTSIAINAINQIGWSSINTSNAPLPSNIVNDMIRLPDGRMVLALEGGAAIWTAAADNEVQDQWLIFTQQNSPLPDRLVLSLASDTQGGIWFGTAGGLARFDTQGWQVFRGRDIGLQSEQINAMAVGEDGNLWIGTQQGVAVFDGTAWKAYSGASSGLQNETVFSLAIDGETIWFGTLSGVSELNTLSGEWRSYNLADFGVGWGGVADLLVDSEGRLWAATLGGGINLWDGEDWSYLRTSNSNLPTNTVQEVEEIEPGVYWIGVSTPNSAGGVVTRFDGTEWRIYKPIFTGYSGGETLAIARDSLGRLWFATRTAGVDLFEAGE